MLLYKNKQLYFTSLKCYFLLVKYESIHKTNDQTCFDQSN